MFAITCLEKAKISFQYFCFQIEVRHICRTVFAQDQEQLSNNTVIEYMSQASNNGWKTKNTYMPVVFTDSLCNPSAESQQFATGTNAC